jgi:hypothetical protein
MSNGVEYGILSLTDRVGVVIFFLKVKVKGKERRNVKKLGEWFIIVRRFKLRFFLPDCLRKEHER